MPEAPQKLRVSLHGLRSPLFRRWGCGRLRCLRCRRWRCRSCGRARSNGYSGPGLVPASGEARASPRLAPTPESSIRTPPFPAPPLSGTGPSRVERLFRARPRAGIEDAHLPRFRDRSTPRCPTRRDVAGDSGLLACRRPCRPNHPQLTRAFRMRPRAGIEDARLPVFEIVQPRAAQPAEMLRVIFGVYGHVGRTPATHAGLPHAPRAGIEDARLTVFETVQPRAAQPAEILRVIPASSVSKAISAAPQLTRTFRMRPRAGIDDARLPVFEIVQPRAAQPAEMLRVIPSSACVVPAIAAEPPLLTRAFRMRPRAGIPDTHLPVCLIPETDAVVPEPRPTSRPSRRRSSTAAPSFSSGPIACVREPASTVRRWRPTILSSRPRRF